MNDKSANHSSTSRRTVMKTALAAGAGALVPKMLGCSQMNFSSSLTARHRQDASDFLADYEREYQRLYTRTNEAQWIAATDVSDEHTQAAAEAQKAMDAYVGAKDRMEKITALREAAWADDPIVIRQLDRAWMAAAHAPGSIPELVRQRADAESRHAAGMNGFVYEIKQPGKDPRKVTANDIDDILVKSNNLDERRAAWEASKELGVAMRPGLVRLQALRNKVARELKFHSLLDLEVTDDGLSVRELMELMRTVLAQTRPLYEQLHCWAKNRLAKRFNQPVPRRIPAHWLPNRWGQEWRGLVSSVDLEPMFKDKSPEWIIRTAEQFYVSLGFPKLPATFWARSDLYDLPSTATRKKNRHASAWHINLKDDVRSLMSVKADSWWFSTTHHELGHTYYYISYSTPQVPLLLRGGANGAFHEAIGDLIALAAKQQPYMSQLGLMPPGGGGNPATWLLADALEGSIVFLPFTCGVMTGWENDFYEHDLAADKLNARWWELVREHQGIDPPELRDEHFCDAASKTHINDTPAYYYRYAVGTLIKHQIHDYIARKILKQEPRSCNYYGRKDVGEYLHALLSLGATRDWRAVLRDFTGEDLSARALMDYYAPLMDFLKTENAGQDASFS